MAGHNPCVDEVTRRQIKDIKPKSMVDVGAGAGYYGKIVKEDFPECRTAGIEIFGPYVTKYNLTGIYDKVVNNDIKNVINLLEGDLIIFGDVLEHMPKEDALYVLDIAVKNFKYVLINGPKRFEDQGVVDGNKYERHLCDIGMKDCENYTIMEHNDFDLMINILIRGKA